MDDINEGMSAATKARAVFGVSAAPEAPPMDMDDPGSWTAKDLKALLPHLLARRDDATIDLIVRGLYNRARHAEKQYKQLLGHLR